jgi:hypothetical protein
MKVERYCGLAAAAIVGFMGVAVARADVPEPRVGMFVDRADIERARARAESDPLAREYKAQVMKIADAWLARPDEWIRGIMPKAGSRFAYGTAGCPDCGKSWGNFGARVASFDRPKVLICPHCQTEFDLNKTDGKYADHGDGVVVNGKRFHVRAVWNGFVVEQMWSAFAAESSAVVTLCDAYALTGDERYARKLLAIMDALATLAPTTNGPRDFNEELDKDAGRLQHLTSIAFRAQVHFARALDLIGRLKAVDEPSVTNPKAGSVWDNIRQGIFEEYLFKPIDTRNGNLTTLHNHEADSVRGLLVTGMLFGQPDYVRWAAGQIGAFYDNTIDRDGLYYETSLSYTDFTRGVFVDMADILNRYDPQRYPDAAKMPRRDELPYNGNYFDHPNLQRLVLDQPSRVSIVGRQPTYGNNHFDTNVWKQPGRAYGRWEHNQVLRYTMYATDDGVKRKATALAQRMAPFAGQKPFGGWWTLYRAPDVKPLATEVASPAKAGGAKGARAAAAAATQPFVPAVETSDFMGQTGLVLLRSGQGADRQGAAMRVGTNLPHSHDDAMALMLFARGRALSADMGYGIFGNHVHLGYATRAIAHHTVVVNQDATSNDRLFRINAGGSIERFFDGDGVRWVEASHAKQFEPSDGVKDYRRLVVQIDLGGGAGYWVDLFEVDGGRVHDYSMHGLPGADFKVEGAEPKAVDGAWTLAGLDPKYTGASFDAPGRSWGQRLTINGIIAKIPGVTDEVPAKGWWYATPGNGYGFLYDVKRGAAAGPTWTATWRWPDAKDPYGLRLTMATTDGQQVVTATGPTLNGKDEMKFVVARNGTPGEDKPVTSRYAAVIEAFGDAPAITSVEPIRQERTIVGLRVRAGDREDVVLDARKGSVRVDGVAGLDSGVAVVRKRNGKVEGLAVSGAGSIEVDGLALAPAQSRLGGKIVAVDDAQRTFRVDPPLPASAVNGIVVVSGNGYSHASAYRPASASPDGSIRPADSELALGRGKVRTRTDGGFVASAPLVFGFEYEKSTHFVDGKRIVVAGKPGRVTGMDGFKSLRTEGVAVTDGDEFAVYDVQPGDDVTLDATASVTKVGNEWVVRSNVPVTVAFPQNVSVADGSGPKNPASRVTLEAPQLTNGPVRFRSEE